MKRKERREWVALVKSFGIDRMRKSARGFICEMLSKAPKLAQDESLPVEVKEDARGANPVATS